MTTPVIVVNVGGASERYGVRLEGGRVSGAKFKKVSDSDGNML